MTDKRPNPTLAYTDRARTQVDNKPVHPALDRTVSAPPIPTTTAQPAAARTVTDPRATGNARSTVLPRVEHVEGTPRVVASGKARYEAVRPLGAGGQAEVTLARDHDIDRQVAVKRLLPELSDDASVLRFAEEIRAVGQLEHPNIVPIHDVGIDEDGRYFFVMKYVEGETLEDIIAKLRGGDEAYLKRYTPEYRLQICNEILRGVEHAHALGIVHRDLKPANVMVGSLGEAVIMDWGLAKKLGAPEPEQAARPSAADERARLFQTQAGALLGTPAYMAPEQAAGDLAKIDVRSDVYSLSVMFYEFLSLSHPRDHLNTVAEMVASVAFEPITKGHVLEDFVGAGAPAALAHFVRHGLERDPAQRYQTVGEMRERLEAVRDGRAPVECPCTLAQSMLDRTARTLSRRPFLFLTAAGFGALGLLGALVTLAVLLMR
jgi:eukaryotic-like serine/threonine-protein kinase